MRGLMRVKMPKIEKLAESLYLQVSFTKVLNQTIPDHESVM